MRSNCRSDFMSHCSGVTPGGKEALQCLQKNVEQLSPGCQAAVRATLPPPAPKQAAAPPAPAAPAPAVAAAPPPAPPAATANTAPVVSAPPPHAKTVKPAPRHAVAAAAAPIAAPAAPARVPTEAEQSAMRSYCRNDFMSHCRGVAPGGRDALACLQRNVARLSPSCRNVVSATMHAPARPVAVTPAEPPAAMEPEEPAPREGFVRGGILINKACARYMLMHCRGMALDMGRKVACLVDYVKAGHFVGPRCRAALEISGQLR